MIALAFVACFATAPFHCQPVSLTFADNGDGRPVTPMVCLMRGQIEIAHWSSDHPGWRITGGYRCGPVRTARR